MTDDANERARLQKLRFDATAAAQDFLMNKGLYSTIDTSDELGSRIEKLIRDASVGTFDCYCTGCKRETPFIVAGIEVKNSGGGLRGGNALAYPPSVFVVRSVCQRDLTTYLYAFQKVSDKIIKIGQNPSLADISFRELAGIDKSLEPLDRREIGKAIGLFAHDAASGAFVYLRRVFERMLLRAYERQAANSGPVEGFDGLRVDEKIAALKAELPERVVRHSAVFSVLSVGIHELTDEQCKSLFPVVKAVIFQMLEQEEHKRKKEASDQATDTAFQTLLTSGAVAKPRAKAAPVPKT